MHERYLRDNPNDLNTTENLNTLKQKYRCRMKVEFVYVWINIFIMMGLAVYSAFGLSYLFRKHYYIIITRYTICRVQILVWIFDDLHCSTKFLDSITTIDYLPLLMLYMSIGCRKFCKHAGSRLQLGSRYR